MDFYSGSNLQYSSLKHIVMVFNFGKNDPTSRRALKTKMLFKSLENSEIQILCWNALVAKR